jgi:hypothetical protein
VRITASVKGVDEHRITFQLTASNPGKKRVKAVVFVENAAVQQGERSTNVFNWLNTAHPFASRGAPAPVADLLPGATVPLAELHVLIEQDQRTPDTTLTATIGLQRGRKASLLTVEGLSVPRQPPT